MIELEDNIRNFEEITSRVASLKTRIRKNICNDIFERLIYLKPNSFIIQNYNRKYPLAAFNPGALLRGDEFEIFPRFIFDYYWYVSSIGKLKLNLKDMQKRVDEPIKSNIFLYPREEWEIKGVEDPRIFFANNNYYILYTAVQLINERIRPLQALAIMDENGKIHKKFFLKLKIKEKTFIPNSWKDSAILRLLNNNLALLLTRPCLNSLEICWSCNVNLENGEVDISSLEPVLLNEDFEKKVGWSTNAEKISEDEYLIGWHGAGYDMKYRNGLALLDSNGKLKAITDYVLEPSGINELYGDRPFVIFGCGLIKFRNELYWIGGISDYAIGIFRTELDKVFECFKWIDRS